MLESAWVGASRLLLKREFASTLLLLLRCVHAIQQICQQHIALWLTHTHTHTDRHTATVYYTSRTSHQFMVATTWANTEAPFS